VPHKTSKTHPRKRKYLEGSIQNACFLHATVASAAAAAAAAIDAFLFVQFLKDTIMASGEQWWKL